MSCLYDFHATDIKGHQRALSEWRGQVLLIVNLASRCGFTPQYKGLQALHQTYAEQGFSVLGFPCDQFAHQEPGDEADIARFCSLEYGVSFPMFAKIAVNGSAAHPLYRWLKAQASGLLGSRSIKWNFTKFLISRAGRVRRRFAPSVTPQHIEADIVAALAERPQPLKDR